MKKIILSAVAAFSLATTSTMAAAAPMAPMPVSTPLTQPASENISGDSQLVGSSGLGLVFGVAVIVTFVAVIVFAIKSTDDRGSTPVIRTSP